MGTYCPLNNKGSLKGSFIDMNCAGCGTVLNDGAEFCGICGTRVVNDQMPLYPGESMNTDATELLMSSEYNVQPEYTMQPEYNMHPQQINNQVSGYSEPVSQYIPEKPKSSSGMILLFAILGLAVGAGAYFFLLRDIIGSST